MKFLNKHTVYIHLCFDCCNTSYTLFQCSLHDWSHNYNVNCLASYQSQGKRRAQDESTVLQNFLFLQQNPQETFSFPPYRERAEDDPDCSAGEDEEKQPRELCMELGKHHCRMTREILERGHFWKILDIWWVLTYMQDKC